MFFNAIYRLSLWKDLDNKSRNIRLLVLGAILYIIVHSFVYSNYVKSIEIVQQYRTYLYHLIGMDLVLVSAQMFMESDKVSKKNKKTKNKKNKKIMLSNQPNQLYNQKMNQFALQQPNHIKIQPNQQQLSQPHQLNHLNQLNQPHQPNQQHQQNQQLNQLNQPHQQLNQMNQPHQPQTPQQLLQQQMFKQMLEQQSLQINQITNDDIKSIEIPIYNSESHIMNWNNEKNQYAGDEESIPVYNSIE